MEQKSTTVNLPAQAWKWQGQFGRKAEWSVSLGPVKGIGPTLAAAREAAAETAADMLARIYDGPAFATDDDGSVIVAVPVGSGSDVYRITPRGWALVSTAATTPAESVAGVHHFAPMPQRDARSAASA